MQVRNVKTRAKTFSEFEPELARLREYAAKRRLPRIGPMQEAPVSAAFRQETWESARQIQSEWGIYPISFGYLRSAFRPHVKRRWVSPVIPGMPYVYRSERRYRRQYAESMFGVTHKKGGWDCHRHLEILFSGTIPFMPDADRIPRGTMHFYPKELIQEVQSLVVADREMFFQKILLEISAYQSATLSSQAIAAFVWEVLERPRRVYFLDFLLDKSPDYLSMQLLGGLLQLRQPRICATNMPTYLWRSRRSRNLYGRGFGYTGVLNRQHVLAVDRPPDRNVETIAAILSAQRADVLIVGSSHRHAHFCDQWLAYNGSRSHPVVTAFIDGGDERVAPPTETSVRPDWLHRFARELDVSAIGRV